MNDLPLTYPRARKVLKGLIRVTAGPGALYSSSGLADILGVSNASVMSEARYLEHIGMIEMSSVDSQEYLLTVTEAGYHYFDVTADRIRSFCIRSVAIPVIVSVLTSLVLHFVEG